MKSLLSIFTLVFTVMFSSTSFAEWTKVGENVSGSAFYLDFERIRKVDGFVYFWRLSDLLKPDPDGDLSYKTYSQGDCKLFRFKSLSSSFHKEPMGGGTSFVPFNYIWYEDWKYPGNTLDGTYILKSVCSR